MAKDRLWYGEIIPDSPEVIAAANALAITNITNEIDLMTADDVSFNDKTGVLSITDENGVLTTHTTSESGVLLGTIKDGGSTNWPTSRPDGSDLLVNDWVIAQTANSETEPSGIWRYIGGGTFVPVSGVGGSTLRGEPVLTEADLLSIANPKEFETRRVLETGRDYVFTNLAPEEVRADPDNIPLKSAFLSLTFKVWVLQKKPKLLDPVQTINDLISLPFSPGYGDSRWVTDLGQSFTYSTNLTGLLPNKRSNPGSWELTSKSIYSGSSYTQFIPIDNNDLIASATAEVDSSNVASNVLNGLDTLGWGTPRLTLNPSDRVINISFAKGSIIYPITRYGMSRSSLQSGSWNNDNTDPVSWNFEGSLDGKSWVTLKVTNGKVLKDTDMQYFDITNSVAFPFYRLSNIVSSSDVRINITNMEFYRKVDYYSYLQAPLGTLSEILALPNPKDGETRQLLASLPELDFYVFNEKQVNGISGTGWKQLAIGSGPAAEIIHPTCFSVSMDPTGRPTILSGTTMTTIPFSVVDFRSDDFLIESFLNVLDKNGNIVLPMLGVIDISVNLVIASSLDPSEVVFVRVGVLEGSQFREFSQPMQPFKGDGTHLFLLNGIKVGAGAIVVLALESTNDPAIADTIIDNSVNTTNVTIAYRSEDRSTVLV